MSIRIESKTVPGVWYEKFHTRTEDYHDCQMPDCWRNAKWRIDVHTNKSEVRSHFVCDHHQQVFVTFLDSVWKKV